LVSIIFWFVPPSPVPSLRFANDTSLLAINHCWSLLQCKCRSLMLHILFRSFVLLGQPGPLPMLRCPLQDRLRLARWAHRQTKARDQLRPSLIGPLQRPRWSCMSTITTSSS
jgi:hypothetical protein